MASMMLVDLVSDIDCTFFMLLSIFERENYFAYNETMGINRPAWPQVKTIFDGTTNLQ